MILVVFVCNERGVDSAKIACPSMIVMYDEMNATNMYVRRGDFFSDVFLVINQQEPLVMR